MAKGIFYNDNGKVVILRDKRRLLAEIDEAISRAPEKAESYKTIYEAYIVGGRWGEGSMSAFGSSEVEAKSRVGSIKSNESISVNKIERPARSVEFGIGGGCTVKVFDEKAYLSEIRERVEKTPETLKRPVVSQISKVSTVPRQAAAKWEIVGELLKANRKGWFTDGYLLVKGEIPKGRKEPTGKPADVSRVVGDDMAYDKTMPAELLYYYLSSPDLAIAVSREPLLQLGVDPAFVLFRIKGGCYVSYVQGIFRVLENRFPDAEYRINPDMGILAVYEKGRPVAGLMAYRYSGDTFMLAPPLREEAAEAGLLPKGWRPLLETWKGGDAE